MYTIKITDWNYPDNKLPSRRKLEFLDWNGEGWSFLARDTQGSPRVVDLHLLSLDVFKIKMRESALKRGIPASIQRVALINPPVIGSKKDLERLRSCKRELGVFQWKVSSATKNKLGWTKDDIAEAKRRIKRTGCSPSGLDEELRILPVVERFLTPTPYVDVLNEVVVEGWLGEQDLTHEDVESAGDDFVKWLGVSAYNEKVGPDDLVANRGRVVENVGYWPQLLATVGYVMTFTDGRQLYLECITEREPTAVEGTQIRAMTVERKSKPVTIEEVCAALGNARGDTPLSLKRVRQLAKDFEVEIPTNERDLANFVTKYIKLRESDSAKKSKRIKKENAKRFERKDFSGFRDPR